MFMKKNYLFAVTALLFFQAFNISTTNAQSEGIDEILTNQSIPGISLAAIKGGKIDFVLSSGLKNDTDVVNEETVFSAASLSKPIFAYLVMQLVDEGILDLTTPLADYYDYPDLMDEKAYEKVTAAMVLSHTSGLPNWRKKKLKFIHEPGEQYSYSGEGYVWLQRVIEHLKGKSLEDLAQSYVFQPLNMNRSSYIYLDSFEENHAISYKKNGEARAKAKLQNPNAAASLQTTAGDYSKFLTALLNGERISAELQKLMFTPVKTTQLKEADPKVYWGMGVGIQITEAGSQIFQWGDNYTFRGYFTANIQSKNAVVYLTNSANGLIPVREIVGTFMEDAQPAADWLNYK